MREMKDSGIEWIGEIPREWKVVRTKYLCDLYTGNSIKDEEKDMYQDSTFAHPYVATKDIDASFSTINYDNGLFIKDDNALFKTAPNGSTLLCIEGGSAGRKKALVEKTVSFVNKLCCFLPKAVNNRFLFYYLSSPHYEEEFKTNISGLIGGVSVSTLNNFFVTLPHQEEQHRIADFLDRKCAEIDAVIEKTKAAVEEYKKLKQSVITEAVTKGVRGPRPMKPSGVEWIGDVPEGWEMRRIKTLFTLRDEKNYLPLESVNLISLYTEQGVVQHSDLETTTGNKAANADGYKKVYENDIVVNIILCWMGAIGKSDYNGVTSPAYDIYTPKDMANSKFYHYYFRTSGFSGECYKRGKGIMAMRWRTYSDQFMDIKVVFPPLKEQQEISDYLDRKCAGIDNILAKKQQFIKELETYKKSLIYEYVTGKKEVK